MGYTLILALHQKGLELHAQESVFFDGQKLLVLRSINAMGPRYRLLPVLQHNLRPRCSLDLPVSILYDLGLETECQ